MKIIAKNVKNWYGSKEALKPVSEMSDAELQAAIEANWYGKTQWIESHPVPVVEPTVGYGETRRPVVLTSTPTLRPFTDGLAQPETRPQGYRQIQGFGEVRHRNGVSFLPVGLSE